MATSQFIRSFEAVGIDDVPLVGGKNASLGEMYPKLSAQGVRVPNGFAITAAAYRAMLGQAGTWPRLHAALDGLRPDDELGIESMSLKPDTALKTTQSVLEVERRLGRRRRSGR
jgi:phosphoenolpyruvate synthase/pyruvate phosphate dikinase